MIFIYRFIYFTLKCLMRIADPFLNQKSKNWVRLRSEYKKIIELENPIKNSIWVHASSGEIEYAKAVIFEIKRLKPELKIIVTYSSVSAESLFENIRNSVDYFVPLCWDSAKELQTLIHQIKPLAVMIARTDLWPEMIYQLHLQKIPISLISYFPNLSLLNTFFLRQTWPLIDFISCVDQSTAIKIKNLIPESKNRISAEGDTRFDQVFHRLEQKSKIVINSTNKIFVCGSIWPEDLNELLQMFPAVLKMNYQVILSPHDVDEAHIQQIETQLKKENYSVFRLSTLEAQKINMTFDFLLIDKIGYLADAYRESHIAFVGGSFKGRIHSVMEPLCCGLPVLTGPYYENNPEALKYSQPNENSQFVFPCANATHLEDKFKALQNTSLKSKILFEMNKSKGASKQIAEIILNNFLKKLNF